ncbi:MAG: RecX family transcriptional regulator [Solirubrobacterales bacterium]|nr:RecX family transcriptional regulator [Solirubrobacterales bacterium]
MFDAGEREQQDAFARAIGALRRRERSVAEMHAWLIERGVAEGVVDDVISELIEVGELDDDRFARAYADDKRELSGWGPERIEAALVDRGLERSLAESASGEDWDEQLERAVAQLGRRAGPLEDEGGRARALSFLTRRGYDYELAYEAIRRAGGREDAAA